MLKNDNNLKQGLERHSLPNAIKNSFSTTALKPMTSSKLMKQSRVKFKISSFFPIILDFDENS